LPVSAGPGIRNPQLHGDLIIEEATETVAALNSGDIVEVADGLADLLVVILGCAEECGIELEPVFGAVMASNWTKTPGLRREDGKLQKGPNYRPPDIAAVLRAQGWGGK